MVEPPFAQDKFYLVRSRHDGHVTVGQYDSTFYEPRGGVFWTCANDDPYVVTEVEVLKEIDASW